MTLLENSEGGSLNQCNTELASITLPPIPNTYIKVVYLVNNEESTLEKKTVIPLPFAASDLLESKIKSAKLLSRGDDVKRVLEIELAIHDSIIQYDPGDTIGILPKNPEKEVNYILERLNLTDVADNKLEILSDIKNKQVPKHIQGVDTIRKILTERLDIRSIPKKAFIRCLSVSASSSEQKRRLEELCSPQGSSDYSRYILNSATTFLDLLRVFPSCMPPIERLLEHLPRLMPRPYSISSSPLEQSLKLTLSVTEYRSCFHGICSGWLNKLCSSKLAKNDLTEQFNQLSLAETIIPIYFRIPSKFRLSSDTSIPIIMIASGSGIAPFIGFLRHRYYLSLQDTTCKFGKMWLLYGCRYSNKDFLYKDEINTYRKLNILTKLSTSFSRENQQIKYVQDNIKLNSNQITDWILNEEAVMYVCGNPANMAKDVRNEIKKGIQNRTSSEIEAENTMTTLKENSKYLEDVWT